MSPSDRSFLALRHNDKITGFQLYTTERRHFTIATPFRVCSMPYSADARAVASRCCQSLSPVAASVFATFSCLNCNLIFVFGRLWCSKTRMSHNEFHCRTSFSHPFCLELLFVALIILYELDLSFTYLLVSLFCATNSSILTQPENNAADRHEIRHGQIWPLGPLVALRIIFVAPGL